MKFAKYAMLGVLMVILLGSFVSAETINQKELSNMNGRGLPNLEKFEDRVLPRKPIMGDLDKNFRVDWKDMEILTQYFEDNKELTYYQRIVGDMNKNGVIDGSDLSILVMQLRGTGDINANGRLDKNDFDLLMNYMFAGGDLNKYQKIVADIDKDRQLTLNDAIELLRLVYGGK